MYMCMGIFVWVLNLHREGRVSMTRRELELYNYKQEQQHSVLRSSPQFQPTCVKPRDVSSVHACNTPLSHTRPTCIIAEQPTTGPMGSPSWWGHYLQRRGGRVSTTCSELKSQTGTAGIRWCAQFPQTALMARRVPPSVVLLP
jgi:hypothetical protein